MRFLAEIAIEVEHIEGRFASREQIEEQIMEALEAADYSQWDGDEGGQYETQDWEVAIRDPKKVKP